jgi:hypothetical protein
MNIDVLSEKVSRFQHETIFGLDHCGLITICVAPDGLAQCELVQLNAPQLMATIGLLDTIRSQLVQSLMEGTNDKAQTY